MAGRVNHWLPCMSTRRPLSSPARAGTIVRAAYGWSLLMVLVEVYTYLWSLGILSWPPCDELASVSPVGLSHNG